MVEVGEKMKSVVEKLKLQGMSIETIANKMDVTVNDVLRMLR